MKTLFDDLSIKYKTLDGENLFWISFFGDMDNNTLHGEILIQTFKSFSQFNLIGDPLESIVFRQMNIELESLEYIKCLTFFSHAQKKWREFHAQLDGIGMRFNKEASDKSFPSYTYYYISIHSPNHLPQFDLDVHFMRVNMNQTTSIKYSEQKILRLGKGYDTDCHSYDSETNYSYYRMRSDCVLDCYQDQMRQRCKFDKTNILVSRSLLREDYFVNGSKILISCYDPEYNRMNMKVWRNCGKICKVECYMKYYSTKIERTENLNYKSVYIHHGVNPDTFVEHIPEMTLIGFICNFGGLLGMWLGLSILAIFNNTLNFITRIFHHKNTTNVNLNLNRFEIQNINNNFNLSQRNTLSRPN